MLFFSGIGRYPICLSIIFVLESGLLHCAVVFEIRPNLIKSFLPSDCNILFLNHIFVKSLSEKKNLFQASSSERFWFTLYLSVMCSVRVI